MQNVPLPESPLLNVIREILPFLDIKYGPWVAGGAARRIIDGSALTGDADIDIFFPNEEFHTWAVKYFTEKINQNFTRYKIEAHNSSKYWGNFKVTVDGNIYALQLLKKNYFKSAEDLLNDFDLTVCMFATDGQHMLAGDRSMIDLKERKLVAHKKAKKPQPLRLAKYCLYGFIPSPGLTTEMFGLNLEKIYITNNVTANQYNEY